MPNVYELDDFQVRTPTDVIGQHIHLVKFDVTSSDGAANGFNYEDGTFSPDEVRERIDAINTAGGLDLRYTGGGRQNLVPKSIKFFGDGPGGNWLGAQATIQRWFADPLCDNAGACSNNPDLACTLVDVSQCGNPRATCDVTAGFCANNQARTCTAIHLPPALRRAGRVHRPPRPHHPHRVHPRPLRPLDPPAGRALRRPGRRARGIGLAQQRERRDLRRLQRPRPRLGDGGPTTWQAVIETPKKDQSFREFLLELQDTTLTYQPFALRDFVLDRDDPNWRGQFAGGATAPCAAGEPCGFCNNDGVCINTQTGQAVSPARACDVLTTGITTPRSLRDRHHLPAGRPVSSRPAPRSRPASPPARGSPTAPPTRRSAR